MHGTYRIRMWNLNSACYIVGNCLKWLGIHIFKFMKILIMKLLADGRILKWRGFWKAEWGQLDIVSPNPHNPTTQPPSSTTKYGLQKVASGQHFCLTNNSHWFPSPGPCHSCFYRSSDCKHQGVWQKSLSFMRCWLFPSPIVTQDAHEAWIPWGLRTSVESLHN